MNRIRNILRVGRVKLVDDTGPVQRVQIFEGDLGSHGGARTIDKVIKVGHFGLASVPPLDSEAISGSIDGDRSQTFVLGTNHQPSRLKNLRPGDAALYDVRGAKMTLTADGVLIDGAGGPIIVQNYSTCTFMGDLHVTGDVISRSASAPVSLNNVHDEYNLHKHTGVMAGAGLSDITDSPAT